MWFYHPRYGQNDNSVDPHPEGSGTDKEGIRAPAAQRQMRKKNSFGPTSFHLAQTFGAYFFRRHFYFFLCYKRYEIAQAANDTE